MTSIKLQRKENYKNLIIGHLNINSIRNKFEMIAEIIEDFDIFLISESRLDSTFPNALFKITSFKIFRCDQSRFGGELLLCVNDRIPSKFWDKHHIATNIELIAVEFHQNKLKWLSLCVYKPPNQNDLVFVEAISAIANEYSVQYEHIVIFGDFNMSVQNSHFQNLMQIYDFSPLVKEPTCFQSHHPTCIDNFLTNQKAVFKLIR